MTSAPTSPTQGAEEPLHRRELLRRRAMEREGFFVYPFEWWHFDWKDFREYPVLDVPFAAIVGASRGVRRALSRWPRSATASS